MSSVPKRCRRPDAKDHRCPTCSKAFPRPSKLQQHIAYHHEKKFSFQCQQCGKPFSNQDHVNRHYRTAHQGENNQIQSFPCLMPGCAKKFVNKQNLDRHVRIAHAENKTKAVKCPYCDQFVIRLESHLMAEHESISTDLLKCLDCSKVFSSVKRLIHHRIIHTDERRELDVRRTMDRLLDEVERRPVFKCDPCNRIFRSLLHLEQHRYSKIHQSHFMCQVPQCGKTFEYMRNLRQHCKVHHEGQARLSCPMTSCSSTFTCQASMCRHLTKCHSHRDIFEQIKYDRQKRSQRQYNVRSLLSGFDDRMNDDKDLSQQMKQLLKRLLSNDDPIQMPPNEQQMDISPMDDSFDPHLLQGYNEIGLVRL